MTWFSAFQKPKLWSWRFLLAQVWSPLSILCWTWRQNLCKKRNVPQPLQYLGPDFKLRIQYTH
jgi:hypothetical protein